MTADEVGASTHPLSGQRSEEGTHKLGEADKVGARLRAVRQVVAELLEDDHRVHGDDVAAGELVGEREEDGHPCGAAVSHVCHGRDAALIYLIFFDCGPLLVFLIVLN